MRYKPNYNVNPFAKLLLLCEGMRPNVLSFLFRTPVVVSDEFKDLSDDTVSQLIGVRCKGLAKDGICMKNGSGKECFLLREALHR